MTVFHKNANTSSVRYFQFGRTPTPNVTGVKGQILEITEPRQAYKYNANANAPKVLDWWDDEKTRPKMQVTLLLQTDLADQPDADGVDDGRRRLVVTVDYKPGGKLAAIQDAVLATGAEDLEEGAWLALWFTGLDPDSKNPDNPRKLYQANYQRPPAGGGVFQQQPEQQQQQQQQQQRPPATSQFQATQQQPLQQPAQQFSAGDGGFGGSPGYQQQQPPVNQYQQPVQQQPPAQNFQQQNGGAGGFGAPPAGQQNQPGGVQFTTQGPVETPANSYPAPQPAQTQLNLMDLQQRIQNGQSDGQIMAETGAPLEAINGLRNIR